MSLCFCFGPVPQAHLSDDTAPPDTDTDHTDTDHTDTDTTETGDTGDDTDDDCLLTVTRDEDAISSGTAVPFESAPALGSRREVVLNLKTTVPKPFDF